jgi:hypothetical protein
MAHDLLEDTELRHTKPCPIAFPYLYRSCTCDICKISTFSNFRMFGWIKSKLLCYIVSVKVQFFCLPIVQNRVTCRSTKRHVRQPVRNQTFIDRSIIKWVQYACVSTIKFQSSFLKLFTKHLRRSIYPVLVSN